MKQRSPFQFRSGRYLGRPGPSYDARSLGKPANHFFGFVSDPAGAIAGR